MTSPRAVWLGCLLALFASGCGIDVDRAPRDIPAQEQPQSDDDNDTDTAPQAEGDARVFFLDPGTPGQPSALRPFRRAATPSLRSRVEALFDGVSDAESQDRVQTAIPNGTTLLRADITSAGVAILDVSDEFASAANELLVQAVAQIVFTASELDEVRSVRILVDGSAFDLPRGDLTLSPDPVTVFDYPTYNPSSQPAYPSLPSETKTTA